MKRAVTLPIFFAFGLAITATLDEARGEPSSVNILAGMDRGGVALGANFDIAQSPNEAYGAYARLYSKDKSEGEPAIFAFGAEFRGQQKLGLFEYYLTPGFGVIHHNYDDTKLLVGPSLALGVTAELDKFSSIGIENAKHYSWVGKYKGLIKDAFLANYKMNFD
ncbi:MAG: hypothetical protein EOP09_01575 [Proteobacteria bacterium]|nr:MAG: hypothetical protein EOP09_01575 [Pseudomonadota bacterium]